MMFPFNFFLVILVGCVYTSEHFGYTLFCSNMLEQDFVTGMWPCKCVDLTTPQPPAPERVFLTTSL